MKSLLVNFFYGTALILLSGCIPSHEPHKILHPTQWHYTHSEFWHQLRYTDQGKQAEAPLSLQAGHSITLTPENGKFDKQPIVEPINEQTD